MTFDRAIAVLGAAAVLACAGAAPAQSPSGVNEAIAASNSEPLDQLVRDVDHLHPIAMFLLAKRLFDVDRKDEAVFWFYEAQIRWRARIYTYPELGKEGGVLMGESEWERFDRLFQSVGLDINQYATDDVPALMKTLDRALEWDAAHPDAFAPPGPGKEKARKQFVDFRTYVEAHADQLRQASADRHAKAGPIAAATTDDPYPGEGGGMLMTPQELVPPCADSRFDSFRTGATTKADIAHALGRPESWFADPDGTSEYKYACNGQPMAMGGMSMVQRLTIGFKFNAKHVLTAIDRQKPRR